MLVYHSSARWSRTHDHLLAHEEYSRRRKKGVLQVREFERFERFEGLRGLKGLKGLRRFEEFEESLPLRRKK